jgi:hypothetical protein
LISLPRGLEEAFSESLDKCFDGFLEAILKFGGPFAFWCVGTPLGDLQAHNVEGNIAPALHNSATEDPPARIEVLLAPLGFSDGIDQPASGHIKVVGCLSEISVELEEIRPVHAGTSSSKLKVFVFDVEDEVASTVFKDEIRDQFPADTG